jgi:cytoskeletal protein CcmA (bactofilin family)
MPMGLFGRDEKDSKDSPRDARAAEHRETKVQPQPPSPVTREHAMTDKERSNGGELGEVNAYLGKGSRVSGKLNFDGTVHIDGQVEGEISAQDTLIVGERAVVTAQISGNTVVIKGQVTGDINARKRVEIRAPGKLYGNIVTPSLVIQEGVVFEGHCSMGNPQARSAESKAAPLAKEEKGGNGVLAHLSGETTK